MAISTEGKFSIALVLLAVGGGGALWIAPDHTEIGWGMVAVAIVGGIALAAYHFSEMLRRSWTPSAKIRMIALLGMIICGVGLIASALVYFWPIPPTPNDAASFARLAELGWTVKPSPDGIQFEIVGGPLPQMEKSAGLFRALKMPFRLHFQGTSGLDGLHCLSDVEGCTKIEVNAGEFTDISELEGFNHLYSLVISQVPLNGVGVVDPSPLASLTNLRELMLHWTRIRNIEFLSALTKIKSLDIGETLVSDISAISRLESLESLDIRGTRIEDLRPLSQEQNLRDLMVGSEQVPSLVNLASLENLEKVSIITQRDIDLSAVASLTNIKTLWIWGPIALDASPLHKLSKLRSLTRPTRRY